MIRKEFAIPIGILMIIAFIGGIFSIYFLSYHILVEPGKEILLYFLLVILNGTTILIGADSFLKND